MEDNNEENHNHNHSIHGVFSFCGWFVSIPSNDQAKKQGLDLIRKSFWMFLKQDRMNSK